MTAIQLRAATQEDADLLAWLGAETFSDSFAADNRPSDKDAYLAQAFGPGVQAAELAAQGSWFLIAEAAGRPVGYARLLEGPAPPGVMGARPIELVRIYARRPWIGRGVGAALMRACLVEAERRGCDTIWLGVWERNRRAIEFYERWGFRPAGWQSFMLGEDLQTDLVMQRPVVPAPAGD